MGQTVLDFWAGRAQLSLDLKKTSKVWVLVRDPIRKKELEGIAQNLKKAPSCISIFLYEDLVQKLASLHKPALTVLSEKSALVLLKSLYETHESQFPELNKYRDQIKERQAGSFYREIYKSLKEACFFTLEEEERFQGDYRKEELERLLQLYKEEQVKQAFIDPFVWLDILAESMPKEVKKGFPGFFLVDQIENIRPLEERLLEALSKSIDHFLVIAPKDLRLENLEDKERTPFLDYVRGAGRFLKNQSSNIELINLSQKQDDVIVKALFNEGLGKKNIQSESLEIWSCHDFREELKKVISQIHDHKAASLWDFQDIHIAVPSISLYSGLIKELFQEAQLPYFLSQKASLNSYPSVARLGSLFSWLETGYSEAMLACHSSLSKGNRGAEIVEKDLAHFRARYKNYDKLFHDLEEKGDFISFGENLQHKLDAPRLHSAMRKAQARGGTDFEEDWLNPLFISSRYWMGSKFESLYWVSLVLLDLVALEKSWNDFEALRNESLTIGEGIRSLKELFPKDLLSKEDPGLSEEDNEVFESLFEENKEAYEDLFSLFDDLLEEENLSAQNAWTEDNVKIGLSGLKDLIFESIARRPRPNLNIPKDNVISITTLREARCFGLKRKVLFCLGLTTSIVHDMDDIDYPEQKLLDDHPRAPEYDPNASIRWTLGRFLQEEELLVLSSPRVKENTEALPTTILADLKRWIDKGYLFLKEQEESKFQSERDKFIEDPRFVPAPLKDRVQSSVTVIEARSNPIMTPYDGYLGSIYEILEKAKPEEANEYSPTMLEMLADCPHRHFFANMIYLQEFPEVKEELPRHEVGTAVHACLEDFWELEDAWQGEPINEDNFDHACEVMQRVALRVLEQSGVDWKRGPLRRFDRHAILLGLDKKGDSGPRGMLKAALAYHRDLPFLAGPPFKTEMKFGMEKEAPIPLTDKVAARGIIDRLDLRYDEDGQVHYLILDYKTGRGKTIRDVEKGKALQIGIYALVTRHIFSNMGKMGVRGGVLVLNEPNRRMGEKSDALDHPLYGVYREHITATKSGRTWVCAEDQGEVVEQNLEAVKQKISKLDGQVRKGELWQELTPSACGYCDYRDICFHEESILEDKRKNAEQGILTLEELPPDTREKTQILKRDSKRKSRKIGSKAVKLSKEQELAADSSRSASVSAGAGSGKTFILKTRVARLIRSGVSVRSILAITFTEKAAGEIRERIEQALGEALDEGAVDGRELTLEEKALFVKARSEMASASISTIHSFCHQLIAMDPLLSSVPPALRVITGPELEDIERDVTRLLFSHKSPVSKDIESLLNDGIAARTLRREIRLRLTHQAGTRRLVKGMTRSNEEWAELFPRLQNALLEKQLSPLKRFVQEWVIDAGEWADTDDGQSYLKARKNREEEFERLLIEVEDALTDLKREHYVEACEGFLSCLERLQKRSSVAAFRKSKKLPQNWWKDLRDELESAKLSEPTHSFEKEHASVRLALRFLSVVQKAQDIYQEKKRDFGVLDFEDLIERAYQMLVGESVSEELEERRQALIKKLHERFKHVLVDEFQDTDQRQWDIVQALIQKDSKDSTLFIVGDAKQSIYSWRNSDNRVFEKARNVLEAELDGQKLVLSDNYRSGQAVINWVNTFFENVFRSEFNVDFGGDGSKFVDTAVRPQPMKAASSLPEGSVHVMWIDKARVPENSYFKNETLDEFMSVAKMAQKILEGDQRFAVPDHEGPTIGILCRTTRTLRGMGQALDRLAIPYSSSHRAGFFTQESVQIMETALRALVFEQDDISLAGLLRGPLMAWTDRDLLEAKVALHNARKGRRWTEALRNGEWNSDERGQAFHRLYSRWKHALNYCTPSALLRLMVADTGIDIAYAATDRMAALRNIRRLIEMVEQVEKESYLLNGVIDLLSWMNSQRFTAPEGAALAPADDIPVSLTTIHGSKGLEFPIVILPGLGRRCLQDQDFIEVELPGDEGVYSLGLKVLSKDKSYKRVDTVLSSILKQRSHARSRSEEKRLFYVACTRAASHLILPIVANRRQSFDFDGGEARARRALRFASSHRRLVMSSAIPDDPEDPGEFEYRSASNSVFVPVISL